MTLIEKISKFFNKEKPGCVEFAHPIYGACPREEMKLASFLQREEEIENEFQRRMAEYEYEMRGHPGVDIAQSAMFPHLRRADRTDYIKWLEGFVDAGNTPTHYYSYPFSRWDSFYVAKEDFEMVPLYGSDAINIIVPDGIKIIIPDGIKKILGGPLGHNSIFCYKGYKHSGSVPVFSDTVF
ncbi:MAG: hypothetical protein WC343_13650 [Bacilli bacterium]